MNKKKASLTLEVVVIAVLVLLVLIVLSIIFSSKLGLFNRGLNKCDTVCKASADDCKADGYELASLIGSCQDSQGHSFKDMAYCCIDKRP